MALQMGTEKARELQSSIQEELAIKGYSTKDDPVMAEYITIMLINKKTPHQITSELTGLIGDDYDPSFTDWLFVEAGLSGEGAEVVEVVDSLQKEPVTEVASAAVKASSVTTSRAPPTGPRVPAPLFQQAVSGISAPKRPRSPSGDVPSRKAPRNSDLPDRPRAMREESSSHNGPSRIPTHESASRSNPRSLLERVGSTPVYQHPNGHLQHQPPFDPVQSQIDAVTHRAMSMNPNAQPFMPGQGPMSGINGMANPMAIQEMLSTQMAMMAQMAMQLGVNPMGVPMNAANGFPGPVQAPLQMDGGFGGRGRGRGGFRGGRPSLPHPTGHRGNPDTQAQDAVADSTPSGLTQAPSNPAPAVNPDPPVTHVPGAASPQNSQYPERPGTPTLCKFGVNCTNPACRYSHPSPAATAESGLVLSKEPCGNGVKCEDKDCTKAHPSKSQLNPNAVVPVTQPPVTPHTKPPTYHPYSRPIPASTSAIPCRYGSGCTRATCQFQHPTGRTTLPGQFHRGLKPSDPTVSQSPAQVKARMGAAATANRYNKTVVFNKPGPTVSTTTSVEASIADAVFPPKDTTPVEEPKVAAAT